MKIVYATDQYWPCVSGVSVSIDSFRKELEAMGHEIHILAPEYPGSVKDDSEHIHRFRSSKVFFNDENRLVRRREAKNAWKILDGMRPDVVHVQTEFSMALIASRWARKRHVPLVISAHTNWMDLIRMYIPLIPRGMTGPICRWKMFSVFRKADAIVVPTSLMDVLLSSYAVHRPTRVIPTGIRTEVFSQTLDVHARVIADLRKTNPALREGLRYLLFVGRLGVEKDVPFLVDVLEDLLPAHPDLRLVLVGDGPARPDLEALVNARGLAEKVVFVGFVPHELLGAYYGLADIFVFASKVESQGLVVLEAMACGTPVVAIGKMGTREIMGGSNGGYMVDDDRDEFSQAVASLLDDPLLRERKHLEALKHAANWSMRVQAVKMEHFYQLVMRWKALQSL